MGNKPIVVLVVEPEKKPYLQVLDGSLESMQKVVDGYIEVVYPFDDEVALICNEESKITGKSLNRALYNEEGTMIDVIAGTFFLCCAPAVSENFLSLPEELIHKYAEFFNDVEFFVNIDGKVLVQALDNQPHSYLGVNYQLHEHDDSTDIEFLVHSEDVGLVTIDWHTVEDGSDESKRIEQVAKEWAGNLAIGRVNAVLGALKEGNLSQEAKNLFEVFKSEFLDNGDMYDGCIPYNSSMVEGYQKSSFDELVGAGLIQIRNSEGFAYELTSAEREKLAVANNKSVSEIVNEARERSEAIGSNEYFKESDEWFTYYVNVRTGEKKFELDEGDVEVSAPRKDDFSRSEVLE